MSDWKQPVFVSLWLVQFMCFSSLAAADFQAVVFGKTATNPRVLISDVKVFVFDVRAPQDLSQLQPIPRMPMNFSFPSPFTSENDKFRLIACDMRGFRAAGKDLPSSAPKDPIELTLREVSSSSVANVAGLLVDAERRPLGGRTLELAWWVKEFPCPFLTSPTDANGGFKFEKLPSDNEYAFGLESIAKKGRPWYQFHEYDYFAELTLGSDSKLTAKVCRVKTGADVEPGAVDCDKLSDCPVGRYCYHFDPSQKKEVLWRAGCPKITRPGLENNAVNCEEADQCPSGLPCYHFDKKQKEYIRW
jgi:hypothetical protein